MKTGFSYSHQKYDLRKVRAAPESTCVHVRDLRKGMKQDCLDYKGWKADTAYVLVDPLEKGDNSARDKNVQLFKRPALQGMAVHDNKRTNIPKYKSKNSSKEYVCLV